MTAFNSPLELYKVLPKSNCRECFLPSCLAFAAAVISGDKRLTDCPRLDPEIAANQAAPENARASIEQGGEQYLAELRQQFPTISLQAKAAKLGGRWENNKLALNCLGKDFFIDKTGEVNSECHTNSWLLVPLLLYILRSEGREVSGDWVAFRELRDGADRNPLFEQRTEKPLQRLADAHPEFFSDLVDLFNGVQASEEFSADISVVLHPLPKVPVLISYWLPEDDLDSNLNIFFDRTADHNLDIESVFSLVTGMAIMFEKIIQKHSGL